MQFATRDEWMQHVRGYSPEATCTLVRRGEARCPATGTAILHYVDDSGVVEREKAVAADLLEVSPSGCMLRTSCEIPVSQVQIELKTEGKIYLLAGRTRHSTSTIGGFKTGILLQFIEVKPVSALKLRGMWRSSTSNPGMEAEVWCEGQAGFKALVLEDGRMLKTQAANSLPKLIHLLETNYGLGTFRPAENAESADDLMLIATSSSPQRVPPAPLRTRSAHQSEIPPVHPPAAVLHRA
jgi:hypothetical protein